MKKVLLLLVLTFACLFGLVACGEEPTAAPAENEGLKNAVSYVKTLYLATDGKDTAADYVRAAQVVVEGETYTLTWTVEVTSGNAEYVTVGEPAEGKVTITVNSQTSTDVVYKLHCKVTAPNGDSQTITLNHKVPAFKSSGYAEYKAAEDGTNLVVEGIVSAIFSKAEGASYEGLFLNAEDNSGAYYIYSLAEGQTLEGIEEGMKVRATGEKKTHNGTEELITATLEVLDTNKTTITPVDLTEAYKNAADLKADALVGKQGLLVTVKGVTIGGQQESNGYYYFTLNGKQSYVRISSSVCPIPKTEQAGFKSAHSSHTGWTANVTGLVCVYDGAFYLTPVDANAFEYVSLPQLSDADAVALEKEALTVDAEEFVNGATVDLPLTGTSYTDVTISWASNAAEVVVGADGKATVTLGEDDVELTLTATLTRGEVTLTKEFNITIAAKLKVTSLADAVALGASQEHNKYTTEKYVVVGVVKAISNETYGNLTITDGTTDFTIYGTYIDGKKFGEYTGAKFAVGDVVVLKGIIGQYNGTPQMKNADLVKFEPGTTHETITNEAANEMGAAKDHNTYTTEKYTIKGVVVEVKSTTYGNMYVEDIYGNKVYVYGLYSHDGATRYDALTTKPVVGDFVVITGILGQYNDAPQMKNGWLLQLNTTNYLASGSDTPTDDTPASDNGKYVFSNYPAGTQYALNEEHTLSADLKLIMNDGHLNTQVRLYDSESHDATAIFVSTKVITGLSVNAGNKAATLNVYGSVDGTEWVLIQAITTTTSYTDYTVTIPTGTAYTQLKLDAVGDQIRVASITLTTAE